MYMYETSNVLAQYQNIYITRTVHIPKHIIIWTNIFKDISIQLTQMSCIFMLVLHISFKILSVSNIDSNNVRCIYINIDSRKKRGDERGIV